MSFLNDESGQGAAEYILLFGGVIVISYSCTCNIQRTTSIPGFHHSTADEDIPQTQSKYKIIIFRINR